MGSSISSLFPQMGTQMKLVFGSINPVIFITLYTLIAFAVYFGVGYFTDKLLQKTPSKEKFAGIFINNCFVVAIFLFLGMACGSLVGGFLPMLETYQYLVCFSMIFVCFLRMLLSESGRKVMINISSESAERILAKTKRILGGTILVCLSYLLVITSNIPNTAIYALIIMTVMAIYYGFEICAAKNIFSDIVRSSPIAKVGFACNTIKYMNKNWWKLAIFLIFAFYFIEIERLDFMNLI